MGERYAGRYELVDRLGEGAGGTVWRAWDYRAGRYVAAKLLRQRDAGALLRFVREQSLRVSHPHVAPPIGWAAEDQHVLLTMDLVGGGSVATLLGDYGALPVPYAVVLLDQLLDALAAVHEAGLVHRDVKPGNLLLEVTGGARPFLRLGDFGIAAVRGAARLTHVGQVVGTRGYLAPDVLLGAEPAPHHDLWSVGVVGRQLVTGEEPTGPEPAPFAAQPAELPGPLWDWFRTLCAVEPDNRYADATTARAALQEAVAAAGLAPALNAVGTVAGGEDVEVFDHLTELPPGWTPVGPAPVSLPAAAASVGPRQRERRLVSAVRLVGAALLIGVAVVAFVAARNSARSGEVSPTPTPSRPVASAGPGETPGKPCDFTKAGQRRSVGGQVIECQQSADSTSYLWTVITS